MRLTRPRSRPRVSMSSAGGARLVARRRRRARQHRPHRRGHGRSIVAQHLGGIAVWSGVAGRDGRPRGRRWRGRRSSALMVRRGRRIGLATGYVDRGRRRGRRDRRRHRRVAAAAPASAPSSSGSATPRTSCRATPPPTCTRTAGERRRSASSSGARRSGRSSGRTSSRPPAPSRSRSGLPELAGPYFVPMVFVGAAAILIVRRCSARIPYELADRDCPADDLGRHGCLDGGLARAPCCAARTSRSPIVALVTGQVVMVLIMTMTPLHMTEHGHTPRRGRARHQRAHVRDVRALADLRPPDRPLRERAGHPGRARHDRGLVGHGRAAPPEGGVLLFLALFLLGYGWNLGLRRRDRRC